MEITGPKPTRKRRGTPRATPLRFIELDTGCYVPVSHNIEPTGYFKKVWWTNGQRVQERFHRFIWRAHNGPIPDGHEIDHMCRVRCCCNPEHLACLGKSEHASRSKQTSARKHYAKEFWQETQCSGGKLKRHIGKISWATTCNWIREWKAELQTISAQPTVGYST